MSKKISANLDLTKSLLDFQEMVTKLLELNNVQDWDGGIIKLREQEIRSAALILAGQCIAILLYNLSQSQSALDTAMIQTRLWWQPTTQRHGFRTRQILTIGNVLVTLKLPYVVTINEKKDKNQSLCEGFCPFLMWLGMSEGLTPLVWSTVAQYGAITSSFEAACTTLTGWGINLSLKRIERLTYKIGQIGINLRQSKILNRQLGNLAEGNILKGQRVVIAVDGGRSRIRINKKGRKNSKTKRHGFIGKWVEPKLFTIYVVDEQGKKINNSEIPITNDGTYEGYKALLEILEADLVDLGISQAKQVLLIGDGAEWIWIHIPPLLARLGCPVETYQLFDFYHVTENLKAFADAAFNEEVQSKEWFIKARKTLKKGNAKSLISQMDELIAVATGERCKIMVVKRNYILDAYRKGRLNYDKAIDKKLPIGSGAIESLIRQVVNLRIKGNSKFWLKENAEIMLHLRCQWIARSWDNFCGSIFNSFIKPQTF
ncbi:ISLre2 family transposase [uncultured Nostoc sp.]|uniref:ISLre2 family transposase n=1 Tax=uncultured Nostoc sp. TaxID=340711 RepID=UPI0035CA1E7B